MKIIVGLGNPGSDYADSRHNVGFKVVDLLRKKYSPEKIIKTQYYRGWETKIDGAAVILLKPKTYINESGIAIKKAFERFDGFLRDYLIIHDDLDIPLGKLKIIAGKGPGGHNGVISVVNELGSKDFVRIRIGIGRERVEDSYVKYVLSPFLPEEKVLLGESLDRACSSIEEIVKGSLERAMSLYNN